MPKKSRDSRLRGATILFAGAALSAVLLAPTLGSAANLSSTPFAVKAQNSTDTSRFAVRPLFSATPTAPATTTPTTPATTTPTAPATTAPAAPAVTTLKAYTFESASDFTGWSGSPRDTTSSPSSHGGNHSLYYAYAAKGAYYESPPTRTYVVGQTYSVTAWVYNEAGYNSTTKLVAQNDAASTSPVISATNAWTQVSVTFVAKTTAPSIYFVGSMTAGVGGYMHIDDVTISQIS